MYASHRARRVEKSRGQNIRFKIFRATKSFSWFKVLEVNNLEYLMFIDPSSEVLLPFRNDLIRIVWVTKRLCIWVDVWKVIFSAFPVTLPPVMNALIAFLEVRFSSYHRIKEILALVPVAID